MSLIAGLLNGTNKNYDHQITALAKALLASSCVVRGAGGGLAVTTNQVATGEAFILCTRTNGQKVMVHFENTENYTINTSGTKKVYVVIDQAKLDDGSANVVDGSGIASIGTDTSYPSGNYVPLASISGGVITDERVYDDSVLFTLETLLKEKKSSNIPSATLTDLSTATGNLVHITGTTTITGFGTVQAGVSMELVFDGALILTHHASNLILPGGANITTSAGDSGVFVSEGGGAWKCISYQKANGTALVVASSNPSPENLDQNIVLNEDMTALDLVYVDSDGEANKWSGYKNTGDTFYSGSVTRAKSIMVDTNTVVCMFYRASSSYVVAGTIASGAITWGTPVAVGGNTNGFDLCKIDTNAGCIIQLVGTAFNGYPFTVSGNTITLGSPVQVNGSTSNTGAQSPAICQIGTNKVAFVYSSGASASRQNTRVGTISANVLTLGTEVTETQGPFVSLYGGVAKFDTDKFIAIGIAAGDTVLRYQSFTVSGTTISFVGGGGSTLTGLVASSPFSVMEVSTNLLLIAYNKTSQANVRYVSFSANVPTLQTEYTISTTVFTNTTEARKFGCIFNDALFAFTLGSGANQILYVERNDSTYFLKTIETIPTGVAGLDVGICQYTPGKIIIPVAQNPGVGYIFNNGARAVVGILRATGTAGQTKAVATNGAVSTGHVGLVPGEIYYSKSTGGYGLGSATLSEGGTGIRKIGLALTSTKMLVGIV